MAIERRANSRDSSGSAIIAISPLADTDAFLKGMSGGATVINGRPIAMLTEVDSETGMGIALHFDVTATELEKLGGHSQKPSLPDAKTLGDVSIVTGAIASIDAGVSQFLAGAAELQLAPKPDRIVLPVRAQKRSVISRIRMEGAIGPNVPIIVEVADGTGGFLFARKCETSETSECRFSPRRIDRIKLTFPGSTDIVTIRSGRPL